jgi:hypothetical protein
VEVENARKLALERLWWLSDAPLFIDEKLVASFYDAVVRPEYELHGKTVGQISESTHSLLVGAGGEGELGLPGFLSFLGKAKVKAETEYTGEKKKEKSDEVEYEAVHTAGRRLEELLAVYVDDSRFHSRLLFLDCPMTGIQTLTGSPVAFEVFARANDSFPRSLVFLEVKPGAAIIPTMCEFSGGGFGELYNDLISKLWGARPPVKYPTDMSATASPERRQYWKAIGDRLDSHIAMEVLEAATTRDRKIEWVDFRLRLKDDGETLHLHACPRGLYSAGTFGYNFLRRGHRQGVRIVGSLKRGPDLNVLAVFEC